MPTEATLEVQMPSTDEPQEIICPHCHMVYPLDDSGQDDFVTEDCPSRGIWPPPCEDCESMRLGVCCLPARHTCGGLVIFKPFLDLCPNPGDPSP